MEEVNQQKNGFRWAGRVWERGAADPGRGQEERAPSITKIEEERDLRDSWEYRSRTPPPSHQTAPHIHESLLVSVFPVAESLFLMQTPRGFKKAHEKTYQRSTQDADSPCVVLIAFGGSDAE